MTADGKVQASVTVKNTGRRAGATVVQLYIRDGRIRGAPGQGVEGFPQR
jgi:hypothetical protein